MRRRRDRRLECRPSWFPRPVPQARALIHRVSDPDLASVGAAFDQLPAQDTVIGTAAGIFGQQGEHLAHLLAWAVQRGEMAQALLEMPFYHPSIEEMVQSALTDIVRQIGAAHTGPGELRPLAVPDEDK